MPDYEIERERVVERPAAPVGRRTVVERRSGGGYGFGLNPFSLVIMLLVVVLLLFLILGGVR